MNFSASARARGTRGAGETEPSQRRAGNNFKKMQRVRRHRTAALDTARRPTRRPTRADARGARRRQVARRPRARPLDGRVRMRVASSWSTRTAARAPLRARWCRRADAAASGFALAGPRPSRPTPAARPIFFAEPIDGCRRCGPSSDVPWLRGAARWTLVSGGRPPGRSLRPPAHRCFRAPARPPQALEKKGHLASHASEDLARLGAFGPVDRTRSQRAARSVRSRCAARTR